MGGRLGLGAHESMYILVEEVREEFEHRRDGDVARKKHVRAVRAGHVDLACVDVLATEGLS